MSKNKNIFLFAFLALISFKAFSQETKFINYKIKNFGYISIPDNMEIQSGLYKKFAESYHLMIGSLTYETLENRVVFQQKGLNVGEGLETYARVMINTHIGNPGDYPLLDSKEKLSPYELNEISREFKYHSFNNTGIKLINWYGIQNILLNEKYNGIKISYSRQISDNPPAYVEIYMINNNDRIHEIILSYRIKDSTVWKPLYKKIIESIYIDKY